MDIAIYFHVFPYISICSMMFSNFLDVRRISSICVEIVRPFHIGHRYIFRAQVTLPVASTLVSIATVDGKAGQNLWWDGGFQGLTIGYK